MSIRVRGFPKYMNKQVYKNVGFLLFILPILDHNNTKFYQYLLVFRYIINNDIR